MPQNKRGKLVVVTGPAGVGKSTILRSVMETTGSRFSVSVTTRAPRPAERNHRDYHFIDEPTFQGMRDHGELLEWAKVFDHYYGTPAAPICEAIDAGQTVILDIDLQGARQVRVKCPQAMFVLILPPDHETLVARLTGRGTENEEQLKIRLAKAQQEMEAAQASGLYNHQIVNDDLHRAVRELVEIVTQGAPQQ
ncbi:MAG: guanylate kinase [Planctomycetaceae bacterium]|nr:guanylate kinase [Planctomycetaceae bacterium]